ncbi:hypothetical protein F2P79_015300 [Pimephales promelas]|nr:hypothetical protein F2P79_015300 [Pimephales promelas]
MDSAEGLQEHQHDPLTNPVTTLQTEAEQGERSGLTQAPFTPTEDADISLRFGLHPKEFDRRKKSKSTFCKTSPPYVSQIMTGYIGLRKCAASASRPYHLKSRNEAMLCSGSHPNAGRDRAKGLMLCRAAPLESVAQFDSDCSEDSVSVTDGGRSETGCVGASGACNER